MNITTFTKCFSVYFKCYENTLLWHLFAYKRILNNRKHVCFLLLLEWYLMERSQNLWKSINTILIHRYLRYSNANSLWNAKTKWKNVWKRIISYKPHSMLFTKVLCIKFDHIDITENKGYVFIRKSVKVFILISFNIALNY